MVVADILQFTISYIKFDAPEIKPKNILKLVNIIKDINEKCITE